MATTSSFAELKDFIQYFKDLPFQEQVKIAMKWSSEDWDRLDLAKSKFRRLLNSGRFWRGKLLGAFHECNVILALHSEASSGFLTPQKIIEDIDHQFPHLEVLGHNRFRNPRYISVDFGSPEMKMFVLENLKRIQNYDVYFLNWAEENKEETIRIHWLTKNISNEMILSVLGLYFDARFVKKESAVYSNGKTYGSGVSTFVGRLKKGINIDDVPHVTKIAGLESLWTIPSRLPLCLRCDNVGHKAFDCKLSHCRTCKKFQLEDHVCLEPKDGVKSYAQVVKAAHSISDSEDEIEYENTDTVTVEEFNNSSIPMLRALEDAKKLLAESESLIPSSQIPCPVVGVSINSKVDDAILLKAVNTPSSVVTTVPTFPDVFDLSPSSESVSSVISSPYQEDDTFNIVSRRNRPNKEKENSNRPKPPVASGHAHTYSRTATRSVTKTENLFDSLKKADEEGMIKKGPPP